MGRPAGRSPSSLFLLLAPIWKPNKTGDRGSTTLSSVQQRKQDGSARENKHRQSASTRRGRREKKEAKGSPACQSSSNQSEFTRRFFWVYYSGRTGFPIMVTPFGCRGVYVKALKRCDRRPLDGDSRAIVVQFTPRWLNVLHLFEKKKETWTWRISFIAWRHILTSLETIFFWKL